MSEGLAAPENITNIPVSKELVRPAYYSKYLYAINRVAFQVMGYDTLPSPSPGELGRRGRGARGEERGGEGEVERRMREMGRGERRGEEKEGRGKEGREEWSGREDRRGMGGGMGEERSSGEVEGELDRLRDNTPQRPL